MKARWIRRSAVALLGMALATAVVAPAPRVEAATVKATPRITYVDGYRYGDGTFGVHVRAINVNSSFGVGETEWYFDSTGGQLWAEGNRAALTSGAGSGTWDTAFWITPVPSGATTVRVEAQLQSTKRGVTTIWDDKVAEVPLPAAGSVQIWPAA